MCVSACVSYVSFSVLFCSPRSQFQCLLRERFTPNKTNGWKISYYIRTKVKLLTIYTPYTAQTLTCSTEWASERANTRCTYLYVRACMRAELAWMGTAKRKSQCEEALEFYSFGFSFTYFSIHIIIGSPKKQPNHVLLCTEFMRMRASTWNGEEFLPFREQFGCVQCALCMH